MAGVYLHVPFCRQACRYCDFYFTVSLRYRDDYISSIIKEILQRKEELESETINSVYFGGGTPSVLKKEHLLECIEELRNNYTISGKAEITLEANPDDLTESMLTEYKSLGINRLSIGIQSFNQKDLELMRRSHSAEQAYQCVLRARDKGFDNISIDLIYGLPGLNINTWRENLDKALSLPIHHISAYHLTYEEGTVFHHWRKKGKLVELPENQSIEQYDLLRKMTKIAGFEHYEISNFSKAGYRSRHNSTYWNGDSYLGFGPSAHSYSGRDRRWNVSSLPKYIKQLQQGEKYFEKENLSLQDRVNDYLLTSLRTIEGMDYKHFQDIFGENNHKQLQKKIKLYIINKDILHTDGRLKMTPEAWLRSDMILRDLLFDMEEGDQE